MMFWNWDSSISLDKGNPKRRLTNLMFQKNKKIGWGGGGGMWRWGRKPADTLKSSLCMSVLGLNHKVQSFIHRALHFCQEIKHFENQIFNSLLCQVSFCSTDEEILVSLLSKFAQAPSSTVGLYSNFLCLDPRPTTNVGNYLQRFRNLSFIFQ